LGAPFGSIRPVLVFGLPAGVEVLLPVGVEVLGAGVIDFGLA
jgi:hypothetical protein